MARWRCFSSESLVGDTAVLPARSAEHTPLDRGHADTIVGFLHRESSQPTPR
jgi:hypothetical protein